MKDPKVLGLLHETQRTTLAEITKFYGITTPTFPDFTMLSNLSGGDYHVLHADSEKWDLEKKEWVPNHTPWRNLTGMLYLNESGKDFEGGHIVFPQLKKDVSPKPGLLVGFQCDHRFLHYVTPVTSGSRIALSLWMTGDASREERWPAVVQAPPSPTQG